MEEDIKILENFIRVYKELNEKSTDFYFNKAEIPIEIIENLIKEYNYMCKLYYDLGSNYCDLDEKNKKLEKENQSYRDYFGTPPCYDDADYIPKSKLREKIEDYEERIRYYDDEGIEEDEQYYEYKIAINYLQELLQDKE